MERRGAKPKALAERFWPKVDRSGDCWLWLASRTPLNYGRIGRGGKYGKIEFAHRVAWELTYGQIPEGMNVLHRCDNPPCVRPDHLEIGSQQENLADMRGRGRAASGYERAVRGAGHWKHKLTDADVLRVRSSPLGPVALAQIYGVHRDTIGNIRSRRSWTHI